ncbi:MAG: hypothetical protein JKY65_25890 [Planctomycetes bacterium]|nr:hypothetical protein [Planctomycetota bacterium]
MNIVEGPFKEIQANWQRDVQKEGNHGLVGRKPDGTLANVVPGHNFGKKEVVAAIEATLAAK